MERKAFLNLPAPPNYVAGIGRGATGFTTRSDIGAARTDHDSDNDSDTGGLKDEELGLLSSKSNERDDEEAERVYELVEARLQRRKRQKTETSGQEKLDILSLISEQFAGLKKQLTEVSESQWQNMPEASDFTKRNKRERELQRQQRRSYNVSDSVLAGLANQGGIDMRIEVGETNFEAISEARGRLLKQKLGGLDEDSSGVDPALYLQSLEDSTRDGFSDIKKSRAIFKSLRASEPYNPISWISSARLEVQAKKIETAKRLIMEGCRRCTKDPGIWLECLEIYANDVAMSRKIAAEAVSFNPGSVVLWKASVALEADQFSKRKVAKKALEKVPESEEVWDLAVELEDDDEAKQLLQTAVEIIPESESLWLKLLMRVSDVAEKRQILNLARKHLAGSEKVWIEASKLEESVLPDGSAKAGGKVAKIVSKGVGSVRKNGNKLTGSQWILAASECEEQGYPLTSEALVQATISIGLEDYDDLDKRIELLGRAEKCALAGHKRVAQAIYQYLITEYPQEVQIWRVYLEFIRGTESTEALYQWFDKCVASNPALEEFWLRYAKEKWQNKDISGARLVLSNGQAQLPDNIELWLAAIKLEVENRSYPRALELLHEAKQKLNLPRLWYKEVHLLRQLGRTDEALDIVEQALEQYDSVDKLYMQKGQILQSLGRLEEATEVYSSGVRICDTSFGLWVLLSKAYELQGKTIRARSTIDRAITKNQDSVDYWIFKIEMEKKWGNIKEAKSLISKVAQQFPRSEKVWVEKLKTVEKQSEMKKYLLEAMKATNSHALVLVTIGVNFYIQGKLEKANVWFDRAISADAMYGDSWCWKYVYLTTQDEADETEVAKFISRMELAKPKYGEVWVTVVKDTKNFEKDYKQLLDIAKAILLG